MIEAILIGIAIANVFIFWSCAHIGGKHEC